MKELSIEELIPELKEESEDEKIRVFLVDFIKVCKWTEKEDQGWPTKDACVAWLEKQGNHINCIYDKELSKLLHKVICNFINDPDIPYSDREKVSMKVLPYVELLEKQGEKSTDKVEPKFKVGDWVVYTGYLLKDSGKESYVMQVASVEDDRYNFTDTSTLCFDSEKDMRSWTIADAKDGDVLAASDKSLFIYDGTINENGNAGFHIAFTEDMEIILNSDDGCGWEEKNSCHPATREQRDLLFKKMKESGYEWDAEKKELKEIEPAEWSEEDEKIVIQIRDAVEDYFPTTVADKIKNWLKSLRPQVTWKPSEEMLEALYRAIPENVMEISEDEMLLDKLYQGLKYGRVLSKK